jgi:hypothetical protein
MPAEPLGSPGCSWARQGPPVTYRRLPRRSHWRHSHKSRVVMPARVFRWLYLTAIAVAMVVRLLMLFEGVEWAIYQSMLRRGRKRDKRQISAQAARLTSLTHLPNAHARPPRHDRTGRVGAKMCIGSRNPPTTSGFKAGLASVSCENGLAGS